MIVFGYRQSSSMDGAMILSHLDPLSSCGTPTTYSMDGGSVVGVRAVTTWPDPRRQRPRTSTVVGRVLDAASEHPWKWQPWMHRLALRPAVVHLAWSRNEAVADSLGYFRLEGVPEGWVKLNAFAIDHAPISRLVHVPAD